MDGYEQEIHIEDELFDGMRESANRVLQNLLKNMVEKDSPEGKVTIGIDVTFIREFIPNCDPNIEGETRRVLTPKFSHKVGSVMQVKNDEKGVRRCDGTELVWDEETGEYVLRPIANTDQMSIFDADFRCVNDPEEDARERHVMALPGPFNAEGGETEVEADRNAPCGCEKGHGGLKHDDTDMPEDFGMNPPEYMTGTAYDDGFGYEEPGEEK